MSDSLKLQQVANAHGTIEAIERIITSRFDMQIGLLDIDLAPIVQAVESVRSAIVDECAALPSGTNAHLLSPSEKKKGVTPTDEHKITQPRLLSEVTGQSSRDTKRIRAFRG